MAKALACEARRCGFESRPSHHQMAPDLKGKAVQTLVLNHAYEPVQLVGWQKAIYLILTDKADLLIASGKSVRSVSFSIEVPRVVLLRRNIRLKRKGSSGFRKRDVFERDEWSCQYCRRSLCEKTATLDHVIPRSKGGLTSYENTVCACTRCNFAKADKMPTEANMRPLKTPMAPAGAHEGHAEMRRAYKEFLKEFAS